jgi:hypothetical protein
MGRAAFFLAPVLAIVSIAITGCVEEWLLVLTNETGAPVRVRYAVPFFRVAPDAPDICPLRGMPPMARPTSDPSSPATAWKAVPGLSVNLETCEADYVLEPGFSALVYRNGFCDDHERNADQGAAYRPSLEYLVVETPRGVDEWRGWNTAEQFKRERGGSCFLRVRDDE